MQRLMTSPQNDHECTFYPCISASGNESLDFGGPNAFSPNLYREYRLVVVERLNVTGVVTRWVVNPS
jgi:hypothetical protein